MVAALVHAAQGAGARQTAQPSRPALASMTDSARIIDLNARVWAMRRSDPLRAVTLGAQSVDLARRAHFRKGEAQALNYLGVSYQWMDDDKRASSYFLQALAVADSANILIEKGYALNNIASVLLHQGGGTQALVYAQRSLALQLGTKDPSAIAYAHIRLSEILNSLGRYDQAISHAQTAYDLWAGLRVSSTALTALRNLGLAYEGKHQYAEALSRFLGIVKSDSVSATTREHVYNDVARVYLRLHEPDRAIATGLEKLKTDRGDFEIMRYLSEAYAAKLDWSNAYAYSRREAALQDSVAKEARSRQLSNLQLFYEAKQQEDDNTSLRNQLRLSRYLVTSIGIVLLLAGYVLVSLFNKRRAQLAVHRLLEDQLAQLTASKAALQVTSNALVESSRRQRAILDNVPDAMWVKDLEGRYIAVNETFSRMMRRPMAELVGQTVAFVVNDGEAAIVRHQERDVISRRVPLTVEHELTGLGDTILEVTVTPILDACGDVTGLTGIARDVTERKLAQAERERTETKMQHAQKLESLGLLAGGIAHDFNNLLVGILGNAELARYELAADSPALHSVSQIEEAAHRAADLTKQMLAYAGKGKFDIQRLNMSAAVKDMADLLRTVISKKVRFQLDLAADLPLVEGDASQLRQVVMNLITNASDATGDSVGLITLRTSRVRLARHALALPLGQDELPEGDYVLVEVSDAGSGMSPETQARIFDPFFTTKFVGRGLGLAAVLGILRSHRGAIDIWSALGRGSTFRVYLPALDGACDASDVANRSSPPQDLAAEDGRLILVVEDEPSVRTLATRLIERVGFQVQSASDGVEALKIIAANGSAISLVLLDMLMPRMNGEETLVELRRMLPEIPVLLTSGYSEDVQAHRALNTKNVHFIQKPYAAADLTSTIRRILGQNDTCGVPELVVASGCAAFTGTE